MYQLTNIGSITRTTDGASIPADPANADYATYLKWVAQGNTPSPYVVPPVPVPQSITSFKAKAQLLSTPASGGGTLLDQVNTLMANPATPKMTVLAWNEATEFERNSPTVATIATELGLTSAQVDALFVAAAQIKA